MINITTGGQCPGVRAGLFFLLLTLPKATGSLINPNSTALLTLTSIVSHVESDLANSVD